MKLFPTALLVSALFSALGGSALAAQTIHWQHLVDLPKAGNLPVEPLTPQQRHDLEEAIVASNTVWDDCEDDNDWPHHIVAHRVNLGPGHYTLAEAGPGCARSGQGTNGAMWLLRWDAGKPMFLGDLDGWLDAVAPETSHGLHDVAAGWQNSSAEYGLTLYRFNGTKYRLVDGTTVRCEVGTGHCAAVPATDNAHAAGAVATPTKESAHP